MHPRVRTIYLSAVLLVCASAAALTAQAQLKASDFETEDLFFTDPGLRITPSVWIPGIDGDVGPDAVRVPVDVGFSDALSDFEGGIHINASRAWDRYGFVLDAIWLQMEDKRMTSSEIFPVIDLEIEHVQLDAALSIRMVNTSRVRIDVLAGARYVTVNSKASTAAAPGEISSVSTSVSEAAGEVARSAAEEAVESAINELNVSGEISELTRGIPQVEEAVTEAAEEIISSAQDDALSQLNRQISEAEAELTKSISVGLEALAAAKVDETEEWVDPFIGVRGRFLFAERIHGLVRGDVGGFGMNSDLTWQLFGGLSFQVNGRAALHAGWRYMDIDYDQDGYTYNVVYSGATAGVEISL